MKLSLYLTHTPDFDVTLGPDHEFNEVEQKKRRLQQES